MMLGMSLATFTALHVVISLVAIASGFVVAFAMLRNRLPARWNALFLVTTLLTSVTGFMFPFHGVTPGIKIGVVAIGILAVAFAAVYWRHLAGAWRRLYAICAIVSLYLNVFVLVAQLFEKVPQLKVLAPTQSAPPFLASQLVVFLLFVVLGAFAIKRFHHETVRRAVAT
jgi:hypothetical protein